MKSASIRDVQHNLAEFVREVEAGAEIEIRRRNRPVARLVPLASRKLAKADWSGIAEWRRSVWGSRAVRGMPASQIVYESRDR